jgi:hypothetical protein
MDNQPIRKETSQLFEELLELLLHEEPIYPWNPAEPESETYFSEIEQKFSVLDSSESEEIARRAENLFAHLHQCWQSPVVSKIKQFLLLRFGHLVPEFWLLRIAEVVGEIVTYKLSQREQLLKCVEPLLSGKTELDLNLLLCSSFDATEFEIQLEQQAKWDKLSNQEQIPLIIAIARYTLMQPQSENLE